MPGPLRLALKVTVCVPSPASGDSEAVTDTGFWAPLTGSRVVDRVPFAATDTPEIWMKSGSTPANVEPTAGTSSEQSRVVGPLVSAPALPTPTVSPARMVPAKYLNALFICCLPLLSGAPGHPVHTARHDAQPRRFFPQRGMKNGQVYRHRHQPRQLRCQRTDAQLRRRRLRPGGDRGRALPGKHLRSGARGSACG